MTGLYGLGSVQTEFIDKSVLYFRTLSVSQTVQHRVNNICFVMKPSWFNLRYYPAPGKRKISTFPIVGVPDDT